MGNLDTKNTKKPEKMMRRFFSSGLKEYSVIYTNRATNLMSQTFRDCMKDIHKDLTFVYQCQKGAFIPGSGTMAMESAARAFGGNQTVLAIQNGFFSYRWSQIFGASDIAKNLQVMKANVDPKTFKVSPPDVKQVVAKIKDLKPNLVCMPHVETSVGVVLPDEWISGVGAAVRSVGGIMLLDGIAAGTLWANMESLNVDAYITAPQKGWSAPASCGIVMLNDRALTTLKENGTNNKGSFSLDLNTWVSVTDAYLGGLFKYHTTPPTDSMMVFRDAIKETRKLGLRNTRKMAWELGDKFRTVLEREGYGSVAENGFKSPTVIVSYCEENMVPKFAAQGIQVAGKVPFMLDEPAELQTFRVGLFGLEKLQNHDQTIGDFHDAMKTF